MFLFVTSTTEVPLGLGCSADEVTLWRVLAALVWCTVLVPWGAVELVCETAELVGLTVVSPALERMRLTNAA